MIRKLVPDHVKSAIKHYAQNSDLTQKRIAELTGVSPRSVYRVMKEEGLLTHLPRMTVEDVKVQALLRSHGISYDNLRHLIEQSTALPSRGHIIRAIVDMEEGTWGTLLNEIVTARVAQKHNVGVSTAMLNIRNAVDKNAKPGNN